MKCSWTASAALLHLLGRRKSSSLAVPQIVLRPYQEQCLGACLDALETGHTRLGVSLPTGSGKTTVFVSLLSRLSPPAANESATRSLIIVNSIELARQSAEQVSRQFPDWTVEIEQGGKHVASGFADVSAFWFTVSFAYAKSFPYIQNRRHISNPQQRTQATKVRSVISESGHCRRSSSRSC